MAEIPDPRYSGGGATPPGRPPSVKAAALVPKTAPAPDPLADGWEALAGLTAPPEVRLWLRIGAVHALLDGHLRTHLRREHGTTPTRYHAMALLDKCREGMTMGELSKRLMVTNGAITGLVDTLARDGKVTRTPLPSDRRTHIIRLTPAGRDEVAVMERSHADCLAAAMGTLGRDEVTALLGLLDRLKRAVRHGTGGRGPGEQEDAPS